MSVTVFNGGPNGVPLQWSLIIWKKNCKISRAQLIFDIYQTKKIVNSASSQTKDRSEPASKFFFLNSALVDWILPFMILTKGKTTSNAGQAVYMAEKMMGGGSAWHKTTCFICTSCNKRLESTTLCEREGQLFCKGASHFSCHFSFLFSLSRNHRLLLNRLLMESDTIRYEIIECFSWKCDVSSFFSVLWNLNRSSIKSSARKQENSTWSFVMARFPKNHYSTDYIGKK